MAFRGHFQSSDVHKTLRGLKNPLYAAAENVDFVRGLEPPCYLVFLYVFPKTAAQLNNDFPAYPSSLTSTFKDSKRILRYNMYGPDCTWKSNNCQ